MTLLENIALIAGCIVLAVILGYIFVIRHGHKIADDNKRIYEDRYLTPKKP